MENIIITKVRNKNGQECNVNWNLNLEKRMIEKSLVTNFMIKEIFEVDDFRDIKAIDLILFSNETMYYCYNCIFGFNILSEFCIHTVSIDYILVNSENSSEELRVNKYEMKIRLSKNLKNRFIDSNIKFKYNKFINVEIKKEYFEKECIMSIIVASSRLMKTNKLSNIAYNIYELLIIYFGIGIEILKRIYYVDSDYKELLSTIVDKYGFEIKDLNFFGKFVEINSKTLNKDVLLKFEEFKKKTYLLNDIYLTVTNLNMYKEIKINMMVQAIEGFYKSVINRKANLYDILYYAFMNNGYYNKLLSKRDKRNIKEEKRNKKIFLYKAKNHRNYFSHLNENERKKFFSGMELNYAYWKIHLTYRLLIIKYLNVPINVVLLEIIVSNINDYAKKYL